jgi:CDP-glycerol glycerophosphotransferase
MLVSVEQQSFTNWEHIIVDDENCDKVTSRLREETASKDCCIIRHDENRGVGAARNTGAAATHETSEYFLFLDADDVLHPSMLETLVEHMDQHPVVGLRAYPRMILR